MSPASDTLGTTLALLCIISPPTLRLKRSRHVVFQLNFHCAPTKCKPTNRLQTSCRMNGLKAGGPRQWAITNLRVAHRLSQQGSNPPPLLTRIKRSPPLTTRKQPPPRHPPRLIPYRPHASSLT